MDLLIFGLILGVLFGIIGSAIFKDIQHKRDIKKRRIFEAIEEVENSVNIRLNSVEEQIRGITEMYNKVWMGINNER